MADPTPTVINSTGEYYIDGDYGYQSISCGLNANCFIQCKDRYQCQSTTILCNNTEYLCDISCSHDYSCYLSKIISYSTGDFSLRCLSTYGCYRADVTVNSLNDAYNDTLSSVNIQCGFDNSCSGSQFNIANYYNIYINCSVIAGCQYSNFNMNNIQFIDIHCTNTSCIYSHFNVSNTDLVNINCIGAMSCESLTIYANDTVNFMDLTCDGQRACNSVNIWCPYSQIASCYINCGQQSESCDININVDYFQYQANYLSINHITQNVSDDNQVFSNCYNTETNVVIHSSRLWVMDGIFVCSDINCCPFKKKKIVTIVCDDEDCVVLCEPSTNGTMCDVVDGSNATSLTITCTATNIYNKEGGCQGITVICPTTMNSSCNVICRGLFSCQAGLIYAGTDTIVDINCRYTFSCSYMNVYAVDVKHIDVTCSTWYEQCFFNTNIFVPYISNRSYVGCGIPLSCDNLFVHVLDIYEYGFISLRCDFTETISKCGEIQFQCYSHENMVGDYEMGLVDVSNDDEECTNPKCCPFTHLKLNCLHPFCYYQCSDGKYDGCDSQYLYNATEVTCDKSRSCEASIVFCVTDYCKIDCIGESTCQNAVIMANLTHNVEVNCAYNSCGNIIIYGLESDILHEYSETIDQITVNCDGIASCTKANIIGGFIGQLSVNCIADDSCNGIFIDANNVDKIEILSKPKNRFDHNAVFSKGIVYAVNANQLLIKCLGSVGGYSCDQSIFYVSNNTYIECDGGFACLNMTIYSDTPSITQNELNISINFCSYCTFGETEECRMYGTWHLFCGNNYSQFSIFDNHICSNNHCCDEDVFSFKHYSNDNAQCFVGQWIPKNNLFLMLFGIFICLISFIPLIYITVKCKNHRENTEKYRLYKIAFKPPEFILLFIHISDFIVHLTAIYVLICFILSYEDLRIYCNQRFLDNASYCDSDAFCSSKCSPSNTDCDCVGNLSYRIMCIVFYVSFGFHCLSEILTWRGARFDDGYYDRYYVDSCIVRYWQCKKEKKYWQKVQNDWIQQKLFKCHGFFSLITINRYFVLMLISIVSLTTVNYARWYALGMVFVLIIAIESIKIYYKHLSKYDENEEIKLLMFHHFGLDIGSVLWQFVYSPHQHESEMAVELQTLAT